MSNHPDYARAPELKRWGAAPLHELLRTLTREAFKLQGTEWAWRILPRGALVALRIRPEDFRKELRLARASVAPEHIERWHREIDTFLKHFGGPTSWTHSRVEHEGASVFFLSLHPTEQGHDGLVCVRCAAPATPDSHQYKEPLCHSCAMKAGAEDTRAVRARTSR